MDSEYLKKTVGESLTEALASLVDCRCHDAVEYVGYYLIHYVERHRTERKYFDERDTVRRLLDEYNLEQMTIEEEKKKEEEVKLKDKEHIDSLYGDVENIEEITDESYEKIIESIKLVTGAKNVYIGVELLPEVRPPAPETNEEEGEETKEAEPEKKDDDEEGTEPTITEPSNEDDEIIPIEVGVKDSLPKLIYTHASDGHEFMKDQELFKDEGTTFDLWKPPPPKEDEEEEAPPPEEEEEGVEKEVKPPPEWKPPVLYVPQVLLNDDVKYFDIPKLGSYMACGCTYTSYLHENAIPIPPEPVKTEEEEEAEEAPKKKKKGKKGKKKEETPPPSDEEKDVPPPPPLEPVGLDKNMVICLDTLPSDTYFNEEHQEYVSKWCLLLRSKLTKAQKDAYFIEFEKVNQMKAKQSSVRKEYEDFVKDSDKENREEIKGIRKQKKVPEEEKNLRITELNYQTAFKGLQQAFPNILEYIAIQFDPPILIKDLVQCSFNILQIPYKNYISEKQPQVVDWNSCKKILSDDFLKIVEGINLSDKRSVNQFETIPSIRKLLKTFNEDKLKSLNIGLFALYRWCDLAIELREANIALRKLIEKERREKEAEEARQKAEEEARIKAEEEEKRKEAEEEARRKAEEEAENAEGEENDE